MNNFDRKIKQLLEDVGAVAGNTTSGALGPDQAHPTNVGQSGDFYAPGDNRNLFGSVPKKKKKSPFKAPGFKSSKIIRRTPPASM